MPIRGSLTLTDVAARTDVLAVACSQCERAGRHPAAKPIDQRIRASPSPTGSASEMGILRRNKKSSSLPPRRVPSSSRRWTRRRGARLGRTGYNVGWRDRATSEDSAVRTGCRRQPEARRRMLSSDGRDLAIIYADLLNGLSAPRAFQGEEVMADKLNAAGQALMRI
jgi:hypothetical protein